LFSVVRGFCCYFEADLTSGKNVYGKRGARKYRPKQISVEIARRVLGVLPQREKTICLIMLQSGMSVGDVLTKFSFQREYLETCLKNGQKRVRVDVDQRKGNGFYYFTFISEDAVQELRKWLWLREGIIRKCAVEGKPVADTIFIKNNGGVFDLYDFEGNFGYHVAKAKLWDGPRSLSSHMFRKLFKTESRPPERGVDGDCVEFMMGHLSGIESVGGIYDRTPELAPEVIEKEYAKLEPYLNIYTSKAVQGEEKSRNELDDMRQQLSSLTSQVGQLTSMLELMRIPFPGKEAREAGEKALR
jgi:integrase